MTNEQFTEQVKLAYAYGASIALQEAGANSVQADDAGVKLASEKMGGAGDVAAKLKALLSQTGSGIKGMGNELSISGAVAADKLKTLFRGVGSHAPAEIPASAVNQLLARNRNLGLGLGTAAGIGTGIGGTLGLQELLGDE